MKINLGNSFKSDNKVVSGGWVWQNQDAMGLPLLTMFIDHFGTEALDWSPATILMEIKDDFGVECSRDNFDKLMAAIQVLTSNRFYVSLPDFCKIALSLSDEPDGVLPDAGDCAWGITEALLINPPDANNTFTEEIKGYIGKVLDDEGILNPPDVLRIGLRDKGEMLSKISYDFSDDPEMFQAISQTELDRANNINQMVRLRTRKMLSQLAALPLSEKAAANASKIVNKLLKNLEQA